MRVGRIGEEFIKDELNFYHLLKFPKTLNHHHLLQLTLLLPSINLQNQKSSTNLKLQGRFEAQIEGGSSRFLQDPIARLWYLSSTFLMCFI
jgi:hypothetical protein